MIENLDYTIFNEFIKTYSRDGFTKIHDQDYLMVRLNKILTARRQFFFVADILKLDLLYTSPQVKDFYGIEPENYDLSFNLTLTERLDFARRSKARARVIETGQELFFRQGSPYLISSNFKVKNGIGEYICILVQCYLFYRLSPVETVYILAVNTLLPDSILKKFKKNHYHWYCGSELKYFRYPDSELLHTGSNLSERELEVLMHIQKGLGSKEIADKMFLSTYTINTHRKNILKKTGKSTIGEVIYEIKGIGMI